MDRSPKTHRLAKVQHGITLLRMDNKNYKIINLDHYWYE